MFCSENTVEDGFLERWAGKQILFQPAVLFIWTEEKLNQVFLLEQEEDT